MAFATSAPPAERVETARSQSEEAYLRIRDRIVSLDMPPGSVVNESKLRGDLNIGRTPIREALQRLARENLVRSIPHRGTFVTDVNITDLARITEVRVGPRGTRGEARRGEAHDRRPRGHQAAAGGAAITAGSATRRS